MSVAEYSLKNTAGSVVPVTTIFLNFKAAQLVDHSAQIGFRALATFEPIRRAERGRIGEFENDILIEHVPPLVSESGRHELFDKGLVGLAKSLLGLI